MDYLVEQLMPLQRTINERAAYMSFLAALLLYFFSLFLPWTSLPIIIAGYGDVTASGWSEQAYLSVLPLAGLLLSGLPGRKPLSLTVLVLCVLLSFAMLLVDNVEHRSVWLTPYLVDAGTPIPHAFYGSTLDIGFWFGLASMVALSVFGLVWTMHKSAAELLPQPAASPIAGHRA